MSLTTGRGPHSGRAAGRFDPPLEGTHVYVEPFLRRVRGLDGDGRPVVDSERVLLVHRPGRPPTWAFPADDVGEVDAGAIEAEDVADGYVRVAWDAVATWFEEDEPVVGHPRNPYHRVDCVATRRRLRVEIDGVVLVDTTDVIGLFETSLAPKLYVAKDLVRTDLLVKSPTRTFCPYKGEATHWSAVVGDTRVDDVGWSYEDPRPESEPIRGRLAFYPERATVLEDVLRPD